MGSVIGHPKNVDWNEYGPFSTVSRNNPLIHVVASVLEDKS